MLAALALALALPAAPVADPLVDVEGLHPAFGFDLRYATPVNFAGRRIYPEARCLLRRTIAARMVAATCWMWRSSYRSLIGRTTTCSRPRTAPG